MPLAETRTGAINFDNSYARLPERFYARLDPTAVDKPSLIKLNVGLANSLGLDPEYLGSREGVEILAGNRIPDGAEPIAMAYAGHQFGQFVPQLGDGRAILLGEIVDRGGTRRDLQLKGSGRTPFSRGGDGRAAVGPVLREYILSEAMHALGVRTTRSLAAVATGQQVFRETPLPGAVLTRVARSHVRVGTFEYFAVRGDTEAVRTLADHVIARHYPECLEAENPHLALLERVVALQARLIASWLGIGFIHGVMNTDNMSIAAETIDFGPCAFMDAFRHDKVFSSIDHMGRYAYGNQPRIGQWNLARLAQCLVPLIGDDEDKAVTAAQEAIDRFAATFQTELAACFGRKLGISPSAEDDLTLVQSLLDLMEQSEVDFTSFFCRLSAIADPDTPTEQGPRPLFGDPAKFDGWVEHWRNRLASQDEPPARTVARMDSANPIYIPRNHLVEEAIAAAVETGDFAPFEQLCEVLAQPYTRQSGRERYAQPPRPEEIVRQTFCGT